MVARDDISRWTGLSGVTRDNILRAVKQQGVDPAAIDWEAIGGAIKDAGDRTKETWRILNEEYGIARPYTAHRARQAYKEYKPQEIEFNAEMLKNDLLEDNHGTFRRVMRAICEGKGEVPDEIEEEFFGERGYSGKEKQEFIETLCSGWPPSTLDRMADRYSEIAEEAGISGSHGSYAKCVTHRDNGIVVMDTDCMRRAARGDTRGMES